MNFRFPFASRDGGKTIEHSDADGAKHLPRAQGLANGLALVVQGGKWVASTLSGVSVASVFGRTGAVVAQTGDYTPEQVGALSATAQAVDSAKLEGHPASYFQVAGTGLVLGETSATAYRGDRGKAAYDHSQVTGSNPHSTTAAQVGAIPLIQLTGVVAFNSVNGGLSCIGEINATSATDSPDGAFSAGGKGILIQGRSAANLLMQTVQTASWIAFRGMVSPGVWSTWRFVWDDIYLPISALGRDLLNDTTSAEMRTTIGAAEAPAFITKSTAYDFTGITASLIKHTNGDVVATLSGGVPGRSYTMVSVASMILGIPSGVTLYGTSGQWAGPSSFTIGGMCPITIQCMDPFTWLIPSYGE